MTMTNRENEMESGEVVAPPEKAIDRAEPFHKTETGTPRHSLDQGRIYHRGNWALAQGIKAGGAAKKIK